jgi:hypothetical protein
MSVKLLYKKWIFALSSLAEAFGNLLEIIGELVCQPPKKLKKPEK